MVYKGEGTGKGKACQRHVCQARSWLEHLHYACSSTLLRMDLLSQTPTPTPPWGLPVEHKLPPMFHCMESQSV